MMLQRRKQGSWPMAVWMLLTVICFFKVFVTNVEASNSFDTVGPLSSRQKKLSGDDNSFIIPREIYHETDDLDSKTRLLRPEVTRSYSPPPVVNRSNNEDTLLASTTATVTQAAWQFRVAFWTALLNVLINSMRPDPSIPWPLRLPRMIWEMSIAVVSLSTARMTKSTQAGSSSAMLVAWCLLLAMMTSTTGLVDIFVWAPLFATFTSFEHCPSAKWWEDPTLRAVRTCHMDYERGHGRALVVLQCIVAGLVYLMTSLTAWSTFLALRDEQSMQRELSLWRRQHQQQKQQQQPQPPTTDFLRSHNNPYIHISP